MALDAGNKIINTNTGLVADGKDISGGYFSINSLAEIPDYSKITGALCFVISENKLYKYNGTTWELFEQGKIDDVKVNNVSVVTDKVANIDLTGYEEKSNKTTVLAPTSTDTQYPTALATYNALNTKVDKNNPITGATKTKITYDAKGLVTAGENLGASDIPNLDASKITSGTFGDARIASAEIWNGKQNAITSTNKLSASLISNDSTHRFVSDEEKAIWNSKSKTQIFFDVVVQEINWSYDETNLDFPYYATIYLGNTVTAQMSAMVTFNMNEAISGTYAPIAETHNGYIVIYAKYANSITIPTITVWEE